MNCWGEAVAQAKTEVENQAACEVTMLARLGQVSILPGDTKSTFFLAPDSVIDWAQ
jgi:hypothetical protein